MSYGVFDRISQPEGIKSCKTLFGQNLQTGRSFQRIFVEQEKDQFINKLEHLLFKRIWTFDQVQLFIKCPVFRKTGTEKQKNIIFQLIFNEYVNFFPDLFLENIFKNPVFILKMLIKSRTYDTGTVSDHFDRYLIKWSLKDQFSER